MRMMNSKYEEDVQPGKQPNTLANTCTTNNCLDAHNFHECPRCFLLVCVAGASQSLPPAVTESVVGASMSLPWDVTEPDDTGLF